jgi:cytidyltransferase-like protein
MPEEYYQEKINEFSSKTSIPTQDEKIVYTQGVFDLFHSGHVDFLEKCKTCAENGFLVVGILTDEEVYRVYGSYPVTNTYERALALLSCKFVDQVKIGVSYEIAPEFVEELKVISSWKSLNVNLLKNYVTAKIQKNSCLAITLLNILAKTAL